MDLELIPYLRKQGMGKDKDTWSKGNIFAGLQKFFDEHERYPIATAIDLYGYLPSSRQIQRAFGGLVNIRRELGFSVTNYGAGQPRALLSKDINSRGFREEKMFEEELSN